MNNDFIDIMHDRLSQHEMIEPSGLWQDIENSLDSRGTHKNKGLVASRSAIYKAVAGVAAAVLVAVVMWTTLNSPSKIEEGSGKSTESPSQELAATSVSTSPSVEKSPALPASDEDEVDSSPYKTPAAIAPTPQLVASNHSEKTSPFVGKRSASPHQEQLATTIVTDTVSYKEDVNQPYAVIKEDLTLLDDTLTKQADTPAVIPYEPTQQLPQLWAMTDEASKKQQKLEFALSYNGLLTSAGYVNNSLLDQLDPGHSQQNSSPDPPDPQNYETVNVDENEQIVPVRVGLEVWYPIGEKWRIGSGLVYTRLSRKKTTTYTTGDKITWQQKHETASYLGIPLEVSRILWSNRRWAFYASAGAMIEFNLKSKLKKETDSEILTNMEFRDQRPQFSALGRLGLQYNVADRIGIYFEPGGSYYFNNGADDNIYMSHPFRFDINLGLKINLGK